jgi:hypothetical protein
VYVNVWMWEHCPLGNEIFRCGEVYCFNTIFITMFCRISFSVVDLKICFLSLSHFALNSLTNIIFLWHLEN